MKPRKRFGLLTNSPHNTGRLRKTILDYASASQCRESIEVAIQPILIRCSF